MNRGSRRSKRYGHLPELGEINVMPLVDLFMQLFIAVIIFLPHGRVRDENQFAEGHYRPDQTRADARRYQWISAGKST